MIPKLFKGLDPVMHNSQLLRFQVVQALFALLDHRDHADLAQHAWRFSRLGMRKPQRHHQRSNSQRAVPRKQLDNLSPTGLGDGVEYVGCSRRTRHAAIVFPYGNMSSQDSVTRIDRLDVRPAVRNALRRDLKLVEDAAPAVIGERHTPARVSPPPGLLRGLTEIHSIAGGSDGSDPRPLCPAPSGGDAQGLMGRRTSRSYRPTRSTSRPVGAGEAFDFYGAPVYDPEL